MKPAHMEIIRCKTYEALFNDDIRVSYSMKYLSILLILIGFGFISHAYAELDKSILEPFENNDLVIIGTVIQVNTMPSENKTQYNIKVEEYLKGQKSFDMITAVLDETRPVDFPHDPLDYYNRPYFEKDNQVFVYLKQEGATFKMSPYSFTIKKPTVVGPPTVIHPTGPQGHYFSQGDEIVISGTVKKGYLYGLEKSDLDSGFHLVVLNERGEPVDSKKLIISPDGNYKFSFQNKGDLRIPGNYSWEINYENGGMGSEFVIVADSKLWTPLKQFKAGVRIDKIQCSESLQTILKTDGTPACVKPDSIEKLREYGWTNSKILSDELVREKISELTGLLESGHVEKFNELRIELVAFVLLERVDAAGMNLDGINLRYTSLPGANLHNATLRGANIGNADLSNANLQDSDLKGADLSHTRLWGANLHGANLQDSNLEGASFRSADLTLANLQNANLENADIPITANLSATDLRNVKNIPISIEEIRERGAIVD